MQNAPELSDLLNKLQALHATSSPPSAPATNGAPQEDDDDITDSQLASVVLPKPDLDPIAVHDPWQGQRLPPQPQPSAPVPWQAVPAAKRPHAEVSSGASGSTGDAFVTQSEYSQGLQSLGDKLAASMQKTIAALNVDLSSNINESIMDMSAKMGSRMSNIERRQAQQDTRLDGHDATLAQLQQQVSTLSAQHVATSEQLRSMQAEQAASAAAAIHTTQRMDQVQQAVRAEVCKLEESEIDATYK
eukprot:5133407-Karenia_brevis.AAC.1